MAEASLRALHSIAVYGAQNGWEQQMWLCCGCTCMRTLPVCVCVCVDLALRSVCDVCGIWCAAGVAGGGVVVVVKLVRVMVLVLYGTCALFLLLQTPAPSSIRPQAAGPRGGRRRGSRGWPAPSHLYTFQVTVVTTPPSSSCSSISRLDRRAGPRTAWKTMRRVSPSKPPLPAPGRWW